MSNYRLPLTDELPLGQYVQGRKPRYIPRYLGNVGDPYPATPGTIPQISRPQFNFGGGGDVRQQIIDSNRLSGGQTAPYPEPRGRHPQIAPTQPQQQRGFGFSDMAGLGQGIGSLLPGTSNSAAIGSMGLTAGLPAGEAALASSAAPLSSSLIGTGAAPIALDFGAGTTLTAGGAAVGTGATGAAGAGAAGAGAAGAGALGALGPALAAAGPWVAAAAAVYGVGKLFKLF